MQLYASYSYNSGMSEQSGGKKEFMCPVQEGFLKSFLDNACLRIATRSIPAMGMP